MIGRLVIIDTGYQTVGTAVQDLLEVKLAATQAGFLLRAKVMQSSEESSTEAEQLQVNLKRATGSFTSGSGGGSATVVKGQSGDPAHGLSTTERNNTTQAVIGTGTLDVMEPGAFNVLAGEWEFTPTPELMFPIGPSEAVILSLDEATADAITMRAIITLLLTHG
jgi:hypothetical protein